MESKIYNQAGAEEGTIDLPDSVFGLPMNLDLIQQARVAADANRRRPVAHTKDRSEVRGGGRKPWQQKGTGRARHGSRRSPIWKGGGVSHGPRKEKDYSKKINVSMARKALKTVLSAKLKDGNVIVVRDFRLESAKTKNFIGAISKIAGTGFRSALVVLGKSDSGISNAGRNVPNIKVDNVSNLNITNALKFGKIIFTEEAIKLLNK